MCENVRGPCWFAQFGDATPGGLEQGSPVLLSVKRSKFTTCWVILNVSECCAGLRQLDNGLRQITPRACRGMTHGGGGFFFPPDSDGGSESAFPYWTRLALNLKGGGALYWKGERALCCYRDLKWLTELKCVQQRLAAGFLCHVGSCCSSMKHVSFRVAKFQRTERWRQKWRVKHTSAFWGSVQKWEIPSHVNVPNFTALKKKSLLSDWKFPWKSAAELLLTPSLSLFLVVKQLKEL